MNAVIYPRGFIGFDIGAIKTKSKITDFLQTVRGIEFNRPIQKDANTYPSNPTIDLLWKEYVTGVSFTTAFAFRERILVAALNAFGTTDFYEWCKLQQSNPYLTTTHKKFINDTFSFINGNKRSVSISSWLSIVRIDHTQGDKDTGLQLNTKEFFKQDWPVDIQPSTSLVSTLGSWTANPNGFEDLLGTLMVLFGGIN
jgi:hypothetical protein